MRKIQRVSYPSLSAELRNTQITQEDLAEASYRVAERLSQQTGQGNVFLYVCTVDHGAIGEFEPFSKILEDVLGSRYFVGFANIEQASGSVHGYRPITAQVVGREIVNRAVYERGEVLVIPERRYRLPDNISLFLLYDDWCTRGGSLFGYVKWALEERDKIGFKKLATMVVKDLKGAANYSIVGLRDESQELRNPKGVIQEWARKEGLELPHMDRLSDDRFFGLEEPPSIPELWRDDEAKGEELMMIRTYTPDHAAHLLRYYFKESDCDVVVVIMLDKRAREFVNNLGFNLGARNIHVWYRDPQVYGRYPTPSTVIDPGDLFPIFVDFDFDYHVYKWINRHLGPRFSRGAFISLDGKQPNPEPFVFPIGGYPHYNPQDNTEWWTSYDNVFVDKNGEWVLQPHKFVFEKPQYKLAPIRERRDGKVVETAPAREWRVAQMHEIKGDTSNRKTNKRNSWQPLKRIIELAKSLF